MDLETRLANAGTTHSPATTALSSPNLGTQDAIDDLADDVMMMDSSSSGNGNGLGLPTGSIKKPALKNPKGRMFSPDGVPPRITPPPPGFGLLRGSSSGPTLEDVGMDSPSTTLGSQNPFVLPGSMTTTSSSGRGTPQPQPMASQGSVNSNGNGNGAASNGLSGIPAVPGPPSAAEITRRINSKRRRDDDFDPVSFKRRAVSPGMSVHNSPIMQSPLQRDMAPWGTGSRPSSVGGDTVGKPAGSGSGSGAPSESGSGTGGNGGRLGGTKGRIGFQGMVDTNDGITRLSIE